MFYLQTKFYISHTHSHTHLITLMSIYYVSDSVIGPLDREEIRQIGLCHHEAYCLVEKVIRNI